ncbi:MAG: ribonuclease HII [archaeon]
MVKVLGIDEAGRGPVIGPLIIAGVMIKEGNEADLGEVKDSKLLSHGKRMQLDKQIRANSDFKVIEVSPQEIDKALESEDLNLNWLEAYKQAEIINELDPDIAIIDCPSTNCSAYEKYLKELLEDKKIKLIVENKADVNYPTCSAASILAKVRREERISELKQEYGDIGSGYPSDPQTKNFIKNNYKKHPNIFRKTWSTYKNIAKAENQKSLDIF